MKTQTNLNSELTAPALSYVQAPGFAALSGDRIESLYARYATKLAIGAAFLLPLKLSLTYVPLLPLLFLWLARAARDRAILKAELAHLENSYAFFIICVAASALFGVSPLHSELRVLSLAFFAVSILVFRSIVRGCGYLPLLFALFTGQSISSLHSVISSAFPGFMPRLFINRVTESGQLAISLTVAVGVVILLSGSLRSSVLKPLLLAAFNLMLLSLIGFSGHFNIAGPSFTILAVLCSASLSFCAFRSMRLPSQAATRRLFFVLTTVLIPIMLAALLLNLKRGPWLGVTVGVSLLLFMFSRRSMLALLALIIFLLLAVEPLRTRLAHSSEHFFISGGRNVIWTIGSELLVKYPLGIGYENAPFLQKFALEIPPALEHFHNNVINIAVETGWLGLFLFFWWFGALLLSGFRSLRLGSERAVMGYTIACALVAWQVAGLVEYNYGDSEIILIVYMLVGTLGCLPQAGMFGSVLEDSSAKINLFAGRNLNA